MSDAVRIAVLVSGGGTNLQALIDATHNGTLTAGRIVRAISDTEGAYALTRAAQNDIPTTVCLRKDYASKADYEDALLTILRKDQIELIILAGFMRILSARVTGCYPRRILNVHPALIPSFCGKGFYGLHVHEAALSYGVKVTGATVHFVNEVPDGGEIILQKAVPIYANDTPEILQRRVMERAEWKLLPRAAQKVARDILRMGDRYERIRNT